MPRRNGFTTDARLCAQRFRPPIPGAGKAREPVMTSPSQRLFAVALRQREDFDAVLGHPDRMLELRRQRTVARHRGPAVGQDFDMRLAEIDHRLDGEEHARFQRHAFAGTADMDYVRLFLEHAPKAMAAELPRLAHALRLDKALAGVADVAAGSARF